MMRRATSRVGVQLVPLICLLAPGLAFVEPGVSHAASAPLAAAPEKPRRATFVAWWDDASLCSELGISAELRSGLARELNNLQTSYQLAQTQLTEARRIQSELLLKASASRQDLVKFNETRIAAPSERMQTLNFEARLLVREKLGLPLLARIAAAHPKFLSARWFKTSHVPVREGTVVFEEE